MQRAVLVHLSVTKADKDEAAESMAELAGLARAAGAEVAAEVYQVRPRVNPRTFVGEGKLDEIKARARELDAGMVVFDHNLSPTQQRGLEDALRLEVVDRTQLILDIFAERARTNEGKLQVELARLTYLRPRLSKRGRQFSQQRATGTGTRRARGPGEKKLEEDRRRIADRITRIRREIAELQERRAGQRERRGGSPVPAVSLVGYTSAGKSTLFNRLAREKRLVSPQMFTTLDPLLRRVTFADGTYFFLTDTVGFIRRLPPELVTSFKATLEEIARADAIVHVIDVTSPACDRQVEAVETVLREIGAGDVPVLRAYNKIDLLPEAERAALLASGGPAAVVSALTGEGIDGMLARLHDILFRECRLALLRFPRGDEDLARGLARRSMVLKTREVDGVVEYQVMADRSVLLSYLPYLRSGEGDTTW